MTEYVSPHDMGVIAFLAGALRPAPFDAVRRRVLRERVLARASASSVAATASVGQAVRAGEGRWRTLQPGLHVKLLKRHAEAGELSALWRLDAGASIPSHQHHRAEECLVVAGQVRVGDIEYGEGDYLFAAAGSLHPVFTSIGGATLLIRGDDPFLARGADA